MIKWSGECDLFLLKKQTSYSEKINFDSINLSKTTKNTAMKRFLHAISIVILILLNTPNVFSQCTPLDAETCPDPENNGEICPDSLSAVYIGVEYSQVASILAPPELDTNGLVIPLHHITLIDVGNLPEGISWQSNAPNDEFTVGTYYCILLSGTTTAEVGRYPLKIVVDVYAAVGSTPVLLERSTDSTSLSIDVKWDPNGIAENHMDNMINKVWPNPFSSTLSMELTRILNGKVSVEVYNMTGGLLYHKDFNNNSSVIQLDLHDLPNGTYMVSLEYKGKRTMKTVTKYVLR
jgi:hypothetical protein